MIKDFVKLVPDEEVAVIPLTTNDYLKKCFNESVTASMSDAPESSWFKTKRIVEMERDIE